MFDRNAYQRDWMKRNRDKDSWLKRNDRRHVRMEVLLSYGGKCSCCGEHRYEFLAIDHIDGGGRQHVQGIPSGSAGLSRWLRNHDYPEGYRVLCHNCNQAMSHYGYCPHQEEAG